MDYPTPRGLATWASGIFTGLAIAGALYSGPGQWFFLLPATIFCALATMIED